jgi:mRNA-degrading endonuclease RelE of RelBE toxin-antitoxin system
MRLQYTDRFRRAYRTLATEDRRRVQNALRRLAENPRHPGLHVKKMQGVDGIWEARASRALRITFEMHGDVLILRNVGYHDATLKRP